MKKFGFTLSEITVALAAIGITAAITVPLINGILPDTKKITVLKAYKLLTDINTEILQDRGLYMPTSSNSETNLALTDAPTNWNPEDENLKNLASGKSKYLAILADYLKVVNHNITNNSAEATLTTKDEIVWNFNEDVNGLITLMIDIDPANNSPNCSYTSIVNAGGSNCTKPDQFTFRIDNDGNVYGADVLTVTYLANPQKLNDRENDYKRAKSEEERIVKELEELEKR